MTGTAPTAIEQPFWADGGLVVGIDEVGRGALAGPVSVGAVVLAAGSWLDGVYDSKTLSAAQRELLANTIRRFAVAVAVGDASSEEIDALGLTGALQRAGQRALAGVTAPYRAVLLDGRHDFLRAAVPTTLVVKGDQQSQSIAAASIVAKVHRDQLMARYAETFPAYGFASHKGYGSKAHRDAIATHGVCPIHRRSFAPCMPDAQLPLFTTGLPQSTPDPSRR